MKVGDYVRTNNGLIFKIVGGNEDNWELDIEYSKLEYSEDNWLELYRYNDNAGWFIKENCKSSPNIIDLIEAGDYVNGKKVIDTFTDYIFDYSEDFKVIRFSETDILHDVKHIKSIVTKEQFEQMSYKVGD